MWWRRGFTIHKVILLFCSYCRRPDPTYTWARCNEVEYFPFGERESEWSIRFYYETLPTNRLELFVLLLCTWWMRILALNHPQFTIIGRNTLRIFTMIAIATSTATAAVFLVGSSDASSLISNKTPRTANGHIDKRFQFIVCPTPYIKHDDMIVIWITHILLLFALFSDYSV